jgi:hypothetical protein
MQCKICDSTSEFVFKGKVLQKYDISNFCCPNCEFTQTEEPYWLAEAYSSAISDLDLGPVNRAIAGARVVESTILLAFDPNAKFVDWGGGYGVFTRLMRDKGYDFYWRDAYCQNLFAKQFVAEADSGYELLTCFEVFEHMVQPMAEIEAMLKLAPNIFFTTLLPPSRLQTAADWWYLTPEHGQHISIYSLPALKFIASNFGLHLSTDGSETHLLSKKPVSRRLFRAIVRDGRASQIMRKIGRRKLLKKSLLMDDFRAVTGWKV